MNCLCLLLICFSLTVASVSVADSTTNDSPAAASPPRPASPIDVLTAPLLQQVKEEEAQKKINLQKERVAAQNEGKARREAAASPKVADANAKGSHASMAEFLIPWVHPDLAQVVYDSQKAQKELNAEKMRSRTVNNDGGAVTEAADSASAAAKGTSGSGTNVAFGGANGGVLK